MFHAAVQDQWQHSLEPVDNVQRICLRQYFSRVYAGRDANSIDACVAGHLEIETAISDYHDIRRQYA